MQFENIGKRGVIIMLIFSLIFLALSGCVDETKTREDAIPDDAIKITPDTDSFPPLLHSDEWMDPIPLPDPINTAGAEDAPVISPDGNLLLFFFTPDVSVPESEQLADGVTGIWWSTNIDGQWSEPQRALLTSTLALDGPLCLHDNILWFCSARIGNYRDIDIYTVESVGNEWKNWQNAGELLNTEYLVGELYLTGDGNTMYFDSSRPGGYGGKDIWVIEKINDTWTEPINLGPIINDDTDQGWLYVTADGSELWYSHNVNIYRAITKGSEWSNPELIVSNWVGDPAMDDQGNLYFTHHYFSMEMQRIEADIYVCYKR